MKVYLFTFILPIDCRLLIRAPKEWSLVMKQVQQLQNELSILTSSQSGIHCSPFIIDCISFSGHVSPLY